MKKITLVTDNPKSWIIPYVEVLEHQLKAANDVAWVTRVKDIPQGDMAFFLGCGQIVPPDILKRNKHNLVVHESKLPHGKGWSPLTWQILEGKNSIPITLFEAVESVDSGDIYLQDEMIFEGHELLDELHQVQGEKTIALVKKFIEQYPVIVGQPQRGRESFYPKRQPHDSELDVHKTIAEQFDHLRVVDNQRYPAYFKYRGKEYILKIIKKSDAK